MEQDWMDAGAQFVADWLSWNQSKIAKDPDFVRDNIDELQGAAMDMATGELEDEAMCEYFFEGMLNELKRRGHKVR